MHVAAIIKRGKQIVIPAGEEHCSQSLTCKVERKSDGPVKFDQEEVIAPKKAGNIH